MNVEEVKQQKKVSWELFNQISGHYDQLNRILSLGIDTYWRRQLVKAVPDQSKLKILDLATGTGDIAFRMGHRYSKNIIQLLGIDMSEKMLGLARKKQLQMNQSLNIQFMTGNATNIPVDDNQMSVVSMAFGIRNVEAYQDALDQIYRVLVPGGKVLILECTIPRYPVIKSLYLAYFRYILPLIGGLVSGNKSAYQYLNRTVEAFPQGADFGEKLALSGFESIKITPMSLGTATLYEAIKPASKQ